MTTQLQKLWIFCYIPAHSSVLFRPLHSIHSDIRNKPSQLRRISTILHRQGRNEGGQGGPFPERRVNMGHRTLRGRRKVKKMSQILSSIQ